MLHVIPPDIFQPLQRTDVISIPTLPREELHRLLVIKVIRWHYLPDSLLYSTTKWNNNYAALSEIETSKKISELHLQKSFPPEIRNHCLKFERTVKIIEVWLKVDQQLIKKSLFYSNASLQAFCIEQFNGGTIICYK